MLALHEGDPITKVRNWKSVVGNTKRLPESDMINPNHVYDSAHSRWRKSFVLLYIISRLHNEGCG
jgi:hypothetical protein